ncbi:MAG: polysaccharide deacetylase family protein [Verrucomicrobiales bacterium]|nr:polysaccharide deacetylase family protein [Verrucomicrobiales bacterium]
MTLPSIHSYRPRRLLLSWVGLAAVAAVMVPAVSPLPAWSGILIFLPAHLTLLWAQLSPSCRWLGPVVDKVPGFVASDQLWLTLDDGPDPDETPAVLEVLDRHGAKATFFVIGTRASAHPELIREIRRRGHQVANHSATHPQGLFWALPRPAVARELDGGAQALREALGDDDGAQPPPLFRSPVGMTPISLPTLLAERGWLRIGWSARGLDGVARPDLDAVERRLVAGARPGAILALHEGRGHAPELLGRLLPRLQAAGLACAVPDASSLGADSGRR